MNGLWGIAALCLSVGAHSAHLKNLQAVRLQLDWEEEWGKMKKAAEKEPFQKALQSFIEKPTESPPTLAFQAELSKVLKPFQGKRIERFFQKDMQSIVVDYRNILLNKKAVLKLEQKKDMVLEFLACYLSEHFEAASKACEPPQDLKQNKPKPQEKGYVSETLKAICNAVPKESDVRAQNGEKSPIEKRLEKVCKNESVEKSLNILKINPYTKDDFYPKKDLGKSDFCIVGSGEVLAEAQQKEIDSAYKEFKQKQDMYAKYFTDLYETVFLATKYTMYPIGGTEQEETLMDVQYWTNLLLRRILEENTLRNAFDALFEEFSVELYLKKSPLNMLESQQKSPAKTPPRSPKNQQGYGFFGLIKKTIGF